MKYNLLGKVRFTQPPLCINNDKVRIQTCIQKSLIMWNVSSSFFSKFILFKFPLFSLYILQYCTSIISKTLLPLKVIFISVFVKQWKYLCSGKNISWQAFLNENFRGYISPLRAECVVDQRVQPSISCPLWKCEGQSITQLINTSCQQPVTHCHTVTVTQQPVTHCHTVTLTSCLLTINTVIITLCKGKHPTKNAFFMNIS